MSAKRRVRYLKGLLDQIGIGGGRLEMYNLSSAEGPRFAQIAREMTEKVRALGPTPLKKVLPRPPAAGSAARETGAGVDG